jgi:hyperosmotically inducible periplasmic protein
MNKKNVYMMFVNGFLFLLFISIVYSSYQAYCADLDWRKPVYLSKREENSKAENLVTDASITVTIKKKLAGLSEINTRGVHIETNNSIVTIKGYVADEHAKERVLSIARKVDGVKKVDSKLIIDSSYNSSTVNNVVSDSAITALVKTNILADDKVKNYHINVVTINGVVYLNGIVDSGEIAARAIKITKNTGGVKEVVSELEITK